jgi:hypothetical protein
MAIDQSNKKKEPIDQQVLYLGRWVNKKHFKAFVYNNTGERLANSYEDFCALIASGVWFAEKICLPNNVIGLETPKRGRKCQSQPKI